MIPPQNTVPLFCAKTASTGLDLLQPIKKVLDSHWYVLGSAVKNFETAFAQYNGVRHCVGVANGTDALEIALRAVGVTKGDSVLTVANAGYYSSTAIRQLGAQPVYLDVDADTQLISLTALEAALVKEPKALVITHLYGRMADMPAVMRLANAAGVPVVEDCAQAHGASLNGRHAGSFGAAGCFSFYPTKNLGAVGDGGAIITNDTRLHDTLRELRQYGWRGKYQVEVAGGRNSRLDELQAAVLSVKLAHLDTWNQQRRAIARQYNLAFAGLPLQCPVLHDTGYVAHLYVLRAQNREALRTHLGRRGVATDIHYPIPDHLQHVESEHHYPALPVTEALATQTLTLPCFPNMADEHIQQVIEAVRSYFSE